MEAVYTLIVEYKCKKYCLAYKKMLACISCLEWQIHLQQSLGSLIAKIEFLISPILHYMYMYI